MTRRREISALVASQLATAVPIYAMARASGIPGNYLLPAEPFTYPIAEVVAAALAMSIEAAAVAFFFVRAPTWRRCLAISVVLALLSYRLIPTVVDSPPYWGFYLLWQCFLTALAILVLAIIVARSLFQIHLHATWRGKDDERGL